MHASCRPPQSAWRSAIEDTTEKKKGTKNCWSYVLAEQPSHTPNLKKTQHLISLTKNRES